MRHSIGGAGRFAAMIAAAFVAVAVTAALPSSTQAQPQRGGGPKVIKLEEITIEGRVQKPNAFYILNRSNIGYKVMDLRTSFVREVIRSVQRKAF